jgi:hypothetical protein
MTMRASFIVSPAFVVLGCQFSFAAELVYLIGKPNGCPFNLFTSSAWAAPPPDQASPIGVPRDMKSVSLLGVNANNDSISSRRLIASPFD